MSQAMMGSHYVLQALIYQVALHRFLRWRMAGYDPDKHLGGIAYLFVRGMAGPSTPVRQGTTCGVFTWHPKTEMIMEISDLLTGVES
jgi:exodeoxyribonuclease V beta subunit